MSIETTTPFLHGLEERRSRVERFLVAAHELSGMSLEERIEVIEDVIAFLAETMLPHAEAVQQVLYAEPGTRFDRDEIRRRIGELAECDPQRTGRLQELLYALYVITSNHVQKEEEAYLRLLASEPERVERAMGEIGELERV